MRRFVLIGQTASASGAFSLADLASSSGRLDVLLRCVRAALLVSNGLRRDVRIYLVLRGGEQAPRTLRIDGQSAKFIRPDERSLAVLVQKTLVGCQASGLDRQFRDIRPGIAACAGDMEEVLADVGEGPRYVLHEAGGDIRDQALAGSDATFFIGDQLGFDQATLARLDALGCARISLGPVSLHSEDAIAVLSNELDRRRPA